MDRAFKGQYFTYDIQYFNWGIRYLYCSIRLKKLPSCPLPSSWNTFKTFQSLSAPVCVLVSQVWMHVWLKAFSATLKGCVWLPLHAWFIFLRHSIISVLQTIQSDRVPVASSWHSAVLHIISQWTGFDTRSSYILPCTLLVDSSWIRGGIGAMSGWQLALCQQNCPLTV